MGHIISKISELDNVRWTELRKGEVRKVKRAIKITDNDVLLELATGEFSVGGGRHTPNGNWAVMGYGLTSLNRSVLNGLVAMGIMTSAQMADHLSHVERQDKATERKYALRRLEEACATLGIAVPEVAE